MTGDMRDALASALEIIEKDIDDRFANRGSARWMGSTEIDRIRSRIAGWRKLLEPAADPAPPKDATATEARNADVLKRVYVCKRCGAENQNLHFDGDQQVGCARCDTRWPPARVALDAAYKSIFTDAALKERARAMTFNDVTVKLDASGHLPTCDGQTCAAGCAAAREQAARDAGLVYPLKRRTREVYTRAVAMLGDVEVIPGVELRVDEILEAMLPTVRACAQDAIGEVRLAIATLDDKRPVMVHAQRLSQLTERYITLRCPGRRYFIEVGNDREGWIQVCTPAAPTATIEAA